MNIGWLTLLLLLPFVGAIATMLVPKAKALLAKQVALGFSLVTLVLTAIVAIGYQRNGAEDYAETYTWIKAFGAHYALGLDGVGVVLVVLTALLTPVVLIASWNDAQKVLVGEVLRLDPRPRGAVDRRVLRHRRVPLLRAVRGHADPDVLPDRWLRRSAALVRRGEVPALLAARRSG